MQHVRKLVTGQKTARSRYGKGHTNRSSTTNSFNNSNNYNNRQKQTPAGIWDVKPPLYNQRHVNNPFNQQNFPMAQQSLHNQNHQVIPKFEPGILLARPNTLQPNANMMNRMYGHSLLGLPTNASPLFGTHLNSNAQITESIQRYAFNGQSKHNNKPKKEMVKKKSTPNGDTLVDVEQIGSCTQLNGHADTKLNDHNDSDVEEEITALPPMDEVSIVLIVSQALYFLW